MLKRLLLGSGIILTLAIGAAGQTDWKGFYAGGNVGVTAGRATADTSTILSATGYFANSSVATINLGGRQKLQPNRFNGGGQVGYNWQSGHIVYGVEADFGVMRLSDGVTFASNYPCCAGTSFVISQRLKTNWLFTARPRLGYTIGHALFYATGGVAVTDVNYQAVFNDTFASAHENGGVNQNKGGLVGGGGIEYQLPSNKHWSVKGEYLYANFLRGTATSTNLTAPAATAWPQNVFTHSLELHTHIVRGGINYRW
jgi:outer membrane immunogenic protein